MKNMELMWECIEAASAFLEKRCYEMNGIKEIQEEEVMDELVGINEDPVVVGAEVQCSHMRDKKLKVTAISVIPSADKRNGGFGLRGIDINLEPNTFGYCNYLMRPCHPKIIGNCWQGGNIKDLISGNTSVTMNSYMICGIGEGFISLKNSGQKAGTTLKERDFENDLREKGFPEGYIKYLIILHEKFPKWEFEPVITNIDYEEFRNYQIDNEEKCADSIKYPVYCSDKRFLGETDPKYYVATLEAITFFSHPYSMLQTDQGSYENALQFLKADQELPQEYVDKVVDAMLNGRDAHIISLIKNSDSCVNPVFMASIYGVESGPAGEIYNGKKVYNLFNIGAYSGREDSKEYAYTHQWFTPEKCIEESEEIFQDFLDRGQDTLYALDWDYATFGLDGTVNQYATLVNDAEDKAIMMSKKGSDIFDLNQEFIFSIPIYENIPTYNNKENEAFPDPNK